jgi:hypothetical protein
LEREVATLKAVCGKKDEALMRIAQMERKSMLADCAYQGPPPKKWVRETAPRYEGYNECLQQVQSLAQSALSLTPASVAEEAANARVGRDVVEFLEAAEFQIRGESRPGGRGEAEAVLSALREVIAKARESR